ncbi:HvfC/BufC N-terminal domain-containing protein [Bordetella genomosp. 13]|uniref:Putative DNA-binding domain-containing protein n=1 Tax=Bordetella genomosp. 13 TaxID=463040 RepID=A0A1W6Z7J2_9BORD|nr:DNA-binding domain-containing protein [Bordetella genomosp. 13]ARP93232.1 hypothetical protein CAL15_01820 [Bordetella genomosp. 13]
MGSLADYQHDFVRALLHPGDEPVSMAALTAQPGFAVYRNTVIKGCVDALQANFPSVARLVGDDWFRAAAAIHVRIEPPTTAALLDYGAGFADFLEGFEPARELPYLPGVARLDRLWTQSHCAADLPPLSGQALAGMSGETLGGLVVRPHPAARWAWHAELPVYAIWQANRSASPMTDELRWQGDGVLMTRQDGVVGGQAAGPGACAFLDACAAGLALATAAEHAVGAEPALDIARLLAGLIESGALGSIDLSCTPGDGPVNSRLSHDEYRHFHHPKLTQRA